MIILLFKYSIITLVIALYALFPLRTKLTGSYTIARMKGKIEAMKMLFQGVISFKSVIRPKIFFFRKMINFNITYHDRL